jgi:hypothetical protein
MRNGAPVWTNWEFGLGMFSKEKDDFLKGPEVHNKHWQLMFAMLTSET